LPGATVTVTNTATGVARTTTTTDTGDFNFTLLPDRHLHRPDRTTGVPNP
jgi:hypothetical protein